MDHIRTRRCRRISSAGAVIAIVAASSAFGIGATAATAAEPVATTSPAAQPPTVTETEPPATTATDEPTPGTDATAPASGADPSPTTPTTGTDTAPTTPAGTGSGPTDPAPQPDPAPSPVVAAQPASEQTAPADQGSTATPAGTVTITGTSKRMHTLTAETSGWPAGTTFTYQWLHSFAGGPLADQQGDSTNRTFVIGSMENGLDRYAVRVTGTAPGAEPTSVVSDLSAPVAEAPENRWGYLGVRTITITANEPSTQALAAFDGDGLDYYVNGSPSGAPDDSVLPDGMTLSSDGTLSGTPTTPGYWEFWLHTSSSIRPDGGEGSRVALTVTPGAAATLSAVVEAPDASGTGSRVWGVSPDGSTTLFDPETGMASPDADQTIRVRADQELRLSAGALDAHGYATALPGPEQWSSSVAGDTVDEVSEGVFRLRFAHASEHRIAVRSGDLRLSFAVQVDPVPAPAVAAPVDATTGTRGTGQLAYTGADESGPLAWAVGLLASGAGLFLLRLRRRRA